MIFIEPLVTDMQVNSVGLKATGHWSVAARTSVRLWQLMGPGYFGPQTNIHMYDFSFKIYNFDLL